MRNLLFGIALFFLCNNMLGQQAQSFFKLPANNKMVTQALNLYENLLKNDTIGLMQYFNTDESSLTEFEKLLPEFNSSIAIDTQMIEYYSGQGVTTINFVTLDEDTKMEYLLKIKANGTGGSVENFTFWIFKDEKAYKLRELIQGLDSE